MAYSMRFPGKRSCGKHVAFRSTTRAFESLYRRTSSPPRGPQLIATPVRKLVLEVSNNKRSKGEKRKVRLTLFGK